MAVFVTNDFPPHPGGIQRMMSRLAREFAVRDERVVVVAPKLAGSDAFDAAQRYRVWRYPGKGRLAGFIAMAAYVFWARMRAKQLLTIASMWFPAGLAACCVPPKLRGRFAVLAHGTEIAPQRGGMRRRLMLHVFGCADVVVANSAFTRDLLRQAGVVGEICVVNPGIDAEAIAPARAEQPTILSVGRLVARKGFDTMIQALPEVLRDFPTVRYEIVGAGPQRAQLEALAVQLGVSDRVAFLGSVSDDEMRQAYARAWTFALPVRTIDEDVEGFGMVYLEAALAELPVVGGLHSGAEDAIVDGDTGLLVDGTSHAAVAGAIKTLLGDRAAADRMGRRAKERAITHFTWTRAAEELARRIGDGRAHES